MTDSIRNLEKGLATAFMNNERNGKPKWTPSFVYNDISQGQKVFCTIEQELRNCDSFCFSVAFITRSGVQLLKPVLKEIAQRGVRGKILTTDYLCFSDPSALDFLNSFENIELKMVQTSQNVGFHTKGYLFFKDGFVRMVVGSSNLTDSALLKNSEWNSSLISTREGSYCQKIIEQFESLYYSPNSVDYSVCKESYAQRFRLAKQQRKVAEKEDFFPDVPATLVPNEMQNRFIKNLHHLVEKGESKALLVSATGTGKTYAAAFAVRDFEPKRILFLVHREQIARQAMASFKRVIGSSRTYGLLGGGKHEIHKEYVFSTVQTLSREHVLHEFRPDTFDMIIIDEVHRAAADSYQRIFHYFRPKLWLGMSATPQRSDHASIYDLFDHNIACDIGLRQALEEDLLCPFHYYALSDLKVDDETYDDPEKFNLLIDKDRVNHIIHQAEYYGYSGKRLKGLMFVSSVKEAKALSKELNRKGLRTMALSGEDSQEVREEAIARLVQDEDNDNALDYLLTVDIFNEGVDIPEINLVVSK